MNITIHAITATCRTFCKRSRNQDFRIVIPFEQPYLQDTEHGWEWNKVSCFKNVRKVLRVLKNKKGPLQVSSFRWKFGGNVFYDGTDRDWSASYLNIVSLHSKPVKATAFWLLSMEVDMHFYVRIKWSWWSIKREEISTVRIFFVFVSAFHYISNGRLNKKLNEPDWRRKLNDHYDRK